MKELTLKLKRDIHLELFCDKNIFLIDIQCMYKGMYTCIHAFIHTYTYIHTCICIYIYIVCVYNTLSLRPASKLLNHHNSIYIYVY